MHPSSTRPQHRAPRRRLTLPIALALAAALIVTLYGVVATFAPSLSPAALGGPEKAAGAAASAVASGSTSASPSGTPSAAPASVTPSPSRSASPSPKPVDRITAIENKVTDLVNAERVKAGCGKLRTDSRLHKAARDFSALMAAKNFFSHTSPDGSSFVDRIAAAGYPRSAAAAENIAYGYADAAAVVKGWMESKDHRANILNCSHKAVGVGLAYRKSMPYWTQDFGRS